MDEKELRKIAVKIYDECGNFSMSYGNGTLNFFCAGKVETKGKLHENKL